MGLNNANNIAVKIRKCVEVLQCQSEKEFGHITTKVQQARKKLAKIDGCAPTEEMLYERKVCEELDVLLGLEETMETTIKSR